MPALTSSHSRLDERSLALHRRVGEKLADTPELLDIARDNLARWQADVTTIALAEWTEILCQPLETIIAALTERSERATRLRQSSPFAGILTDAERRSIYESFTTRAHHQGRQPHIG